MASHLGLHCMIFKHIDVLCNLKIVACDPLEYMMDHSSHMYKAGLRLHLTVPVSDPVVVASPTADPVAAGSIPARSHTFVEIVVK